MKKFSVLVGLVALLLVLVLAIPAVAAAGTGYEILDTADLSNDDVTAGGRCTSFNPEVSGGWGGEFGQGAVTAFPNDDPSGYVSLYTARGAAKAVRIRHLDGIADDSFDLFVKDVHGRWVPVGHYADNGSSNEQWMTTQFDLTRDINGKRVNLAEGRTIEIKIMPTALGWWGFDTWGQLAIDKVELLGQGPS